MTTTVLNTKNDEVVNKTPHSSGLVTTTSLNTKIGEVENKIPDVSGLVKKTDYNTKISNIEGKYFVSSHYNKLMSEVFDKKLKLF